MKYFQFWCWRRSPVWRSSLRLFVGDQQSKPRYVFTVYSLIYFIRRKNFIAFHSVMKCYPILAQDPSESVNLCSRSSFSYAEVLKCLSMFKVYTSISLAAQTIFLPMNPQMSRQRYLVCLHFVCLLIKAQTLEKHSERTHFWARHCMEKASCWWKCSEFA